MQVRTGTVRGAVEDASYTRAGAVAELVAVIRRVAREMAGVIASAQKARGFLASSRACLFVTVAAAALLTAHTQPSIDAFLRSE